MNLPVEFLALRERFLSRLSERRDRMLELAAALGVGDSAALAELKREAHSLVGAAGLHELRELAACAARIESLTDAPAPSEALTQALAELVAIIQQQQVRTNKQVQRTPGHARIALLFQNHEETISQAALLTDAGYRVTQHSDVVAFEHTLHDGESPDLVLLGLQFGGNDRAGIEFLSRLRARLGTTLPILILSASRSFMLGLAAYKAGATRVLSKPISADTLLNHVAGTLAAQQRPMRKLLVFRSTESTLVRFVERVAQPTLTFEFCPDIGDLQARLAANAYDALLLEAVPDDPDYTLALASLLYDNPDSAYLPILLFTPGPNSLSRADARAAGCATILDESLDPTEFGPMIQSLCVAAARRRREADTVARREYEHARQRQALDHHAIISLADASGTLFETSPLHGLLTGFTGTELIGSHLSERRQGLAPPEFSAAVLARAQTGQVWQGEYRLPCKHGASRWVNSTLVPFLDPQGAPYQYMVIRTDITERKRSEQALAKAHQRELKLAGHIQETLLLPPLPATRAGLAITSLYKASAGVAGDFHALIELGPNCIDVLIGDVMGKGIPAALVGAAVKMELSQCLLQLRARATDRLPQPSTILDALHQRLTPRLIELECFVTLTLVRFDRGRQTLTSVGCGHPEILVCTDNRIVCVPNQHPPLGVLAQEDYTHSVTPWSPGSVVILYSDGLSEVRDAQGAMLGDAGLRRIIAAALSACVHPEQIAATVLEAIDRIDAAPSPNDDRTLIVVRHPVAGEHFDELPNRLDSVAALRECIAARCAGRLPVEQSDRIVLACVEAFTNIVKHARSPSKTIGLLLKHTHDRVDISLHYAGEPFEPRADAAPPNPKARRENGYGLPLIHALCDQFTCDHAFGINSDQLRFELPTPR